MRTGVSPRTDAGRARTLKPPGSEPSGAGREIYAVVVEARKEQPSIELDDAGVFTDKGLDVTDREDASIRYREPLRPRCLGVERIDGAAPKDELGG